MGDGPSPATSMAAVEGGGIGMLGGRVVGASVVAMTSKRF